MVLHKICRKCLIGRVCQASRTASSILDLDDDAVMEASVQAGYTRRSSASVTPVQALPHVLESSADPRARAGKADGSSPAKVNGTHKNGKPVAKQGCCTIS